jgi:uncharacterized membrane protein
MVRLIHRALGARQLLLALVVTAAGLAVDVPAAHASLKVCNNTTTGKLFFDLSRSASCGDNWAATGWFQPAQGQCITVWNTDMRNKQFRWAGFDNNGRALTRGANGTIKLLNESHTNMCWEHMVLRCSNPTASCRTLGYDWWTSGSTNFTVTISDRTWCINDGGINVCGFRP